MAVLGIIEQKQPIKHKLFKNVYAVGELDSAQKSVINASEECGMVAVTGCFGTGKSHVITNLASHYLVNGKKVLIVAKNDNALGVIYDRLVEIGGDYVAMRCGNREKQVDLALKLSNLVSNQVNFSHEYASKLSYWLAKDKKQECKKVLYSSRMNALEQVVSTHRQDLVVLAKSLLSSKKKTRKEIMQKYFNTLLDVMPCWLCTVMDISDNMPLIEGMFDLVIFDESSELNIPQSLPCLYRAKKAVIVGDDKQLKHISFLEGKKEQSLMTKHGISQDLQLIYSHRKNSLFDFAQYYCDKHILLDMNYRSPRNMVQFNIDEFYNGAIKCNKADDKECIKKILLNGKVDENGVNMVEAEYIVRMIRQYINKGKTIGVLSPFTRQCKAIEKLIKDNFTIEEIINNGLMVSTAYGFQGSQKDIMLISWGVADNSPYQSFTFINNKNVFNVGTSRAIEKIINVYSTKNIKSDLMRRYLEYIK